MHISPVLAANNIADGNSTTAASNAINIVDQPDTASSIVSAGSGSKDDSDVDSDSEEEEEEEDVAEVAPDISIVSCYYSSHYYHNVHHFHSIWTTDLERVYMKYHAYVQAGNQANIQGYYVVYSEKKCMSNTPGSSNISTVYKNSLKEGTERAHLVTVTEVLSLVPVIAFLGCEIQILQLQEKVRLEVNSNSSSSHTVQTSDLIDLVPILLNSVMRYASTPNANNCHELAVLLGQYTGNASAGGSGTTTLPSTSISSKVDVNLFQSNIVLVVIDKYIKCMMNVHQATLLLLIRVYVQEVLLIQLIANSKSGMTGKNTIGADKEFWNHLIALCKYIV